MPWGNVIVTGQDGRDIFLDGNYESACGKGPGPFVVTYGKHTFETLDVKQRVECAGDATVNQYNPAATIALTPATPPKKV
jgi:hypothetical protein